MRRNFEPERQLTTTTTSKKTAGKKAEEKIAAHHAHSGPSHVWYSTKIFIF